MLARWYQYLFYAFYVLSARVRKGQDGDHGYYALWTMTIASTVYAGIIVLLAFRLTGISPGELSPGMRAVAGAAGVIVTFGAHSLLVHQVFGEEAILERFSEVNAEAAGRVAVGILLASVVILGAVVFLVAPPWKR